MKHNESITTFSTLLLLLCSLMGCSLFVDDPGSAATNTPDPAGVDDVANNNDTSGDQDTSPNDVAQNADAAHDDTANDTTPVEEDVSTGDVPSDTAEDVMNANDADVTTADAMDVADEETSCPTRVWYHDGDGDGAGDPDSVLLVCEDELEVDGYVTNAGDCDDSDSGINPGAVESCGNTVDENCDGNLDESNTCAACITSFYNGHTYHICADSQGFFSSKRYNGAVEACRLLNARLVKIDTAEEEAWLFATVDSTERVWEEFWIGLNDRQMEGHFRWNDEAVDVWTAGMGPIPPDAYINWHPGEPNNASGGEDCGAIYNSVRAWNDSSCLEFKSYICESE